MNLDLMQIAMAPNPFLRVGERLIFLGAIVLFHNTPTGITDIHLGTGAVIHLSKSEAEQFESEIQALVNKAKQQTLIKVPTLSPRRQQ